MSGGTALAVVMSISAGFAGSVQAAVLGRLGDRVGTVEAVGFSTLVAGATGIVVLLIARRSLAGVGHAVHQPLWMWLGGILSAFIVLSITFAAPKIGVAAAIGLVITGNLIVAALIDRFGWFGVDQIPPRVDARGRDPAAGRRGDAAAAEIARGRRCRPA